MRRARWQRGVLAAWGLWLAAVFAGLGTPMYPMPAQHEAGMDGMRMAAAMQTDHEAVSSSKHCDESEERPAGHHGQGCPPCPGLGCCALPLVLHNVPRETLAAVTIADVAINGHAEIVVARVHRAYEHPFPNGPPAQG